jgi:hypothetical protein
MTTPLLKPLRREIEIEGKRYTLTIHPTGLSLAEKRSRRARVITWASLIGGATESTDSAATATETDIEPIAT